MPNDDSELLLHCHSFPKYLFQLPSSSLQWGEEAMGEIILTSSHESPITAHDLLTGAPLAHFSGSRSPRGGLALVGTTLIAASHIAAAATNTVGSIHLYNWWSPTALRCIPMPEPVAPLVVTQDGAFLFSGGLSGSIHAVSIPSGDLHRPFPAHRQPITCLAISEDGSLLLSGGDDGRLAIFPIIQLLDESGRGGDTGQLPLYRFTAHSSPVTGISPSPGGSNAVVVSSSMDCTCKFWSMADGTHLRTVRFPCAVWCVVVNPTFSEAFSGGSDGHVYVISMKGGHRRPRVDEPEVIAWAAERNGAVTSIAMANGDRNLVSASEDGIVKVWEVESRSVIRVLGFVGGGGGLAVARVVNPLSTNDANAGSAGFSVRELETKQVKEAGEMEEWLSVVEKDRRRAVDTLDAAIGTYKRLLGLILKEAKGGDSQEEQARDL